MSRIAANFAANNPSAWDGAARDGRKSSCSTGTRSSGCGATNCTLPVDGRGETVVPTPTFTDTDGNGSASTW